MVTENRDGKTVNFCIGFDPVSSRFLPEAWMILGVEFYPRNEMVRAPNSSFRW